jgi:UDPglucose 6-dehydrogenase
MEDAQRYWFNPEKNHLFERITYHDSAREAIEGSDVLYISTDWEEFRGLSRTIETAVKPPYLVIDGRRMIPDYNALVREGYEYLPVGGALLRPQTEEAQSDSNQMPMRVPNNQKEPA